MEIGKDPCARCVTHLRVMVHGKSPPADAPNWYRTDGTTGQRTRRGKPKPQHHPPRAQRQDLIHLIIMALPETFLALRATLFDENGTTIAPGAIIAQILADEEHCVHVSCSTNAASTRTDNPFMLQVQDDVTSNLPIRVIPRGLGSDGVSSRLYLRRSGRSPCQMKID